LSYDDIADAAMQVAADPGLGGEYPLRLGWDYWLPPPNDTPPGATGPATDGRGAARTPHAALLGNAELPNGARHILAPAMSLQALIGGLWRQCLIRPNDPSAEPGIDLFAVSDHLDNSQRAEHLVALIGHCPRDLGLYLIHLRETDEAFFNLVIAKDFRAALRHRPDALLGPWPDTVARRWRGIERDYLPPFLVAVLYAELSRLAMNQAGLIQLSFDGETYLTTTQFLERVPMAGTTNAPHAIRRAMDHAPLQSVALGAPGEVLRNVDREAAGTWSTAAAATMTLMAGAGGGLDISPTDPAEALKLRDAYGGNPHFWLESRAGHGASRQPRAAATFWGLNWRRNAAMGLLEIAQAARRWNEQHRPAGARLLKLPRYRLAHAISTIGFTWVAEASAEAGLTVLKDIVRGDVPQEELARWTAAMISPLSIGDHLGPRSGEELVKQAALEIARRPRPGAFGYTARSQAHLWLDDHGDDIAHYRKLQQQAIDEHDAAIAGNLPDVLRDPARVPTNVAALLGRGYGVGRRHGAVGHNAPPGPAMTADPAAARAAQLLGQQISPLSTDPTREMLLRKR
jgi:hypothetical protein